jgi:hypothetical protein
MGYFLLFFFKWTSTLHSDVQVYNLVVTGQVEQDRCSSWHHQRWTEIQHFTHLKASFQTQFWKSPPPPKVPSGSENCPYWSSYQKCCLVFFLYICHKYLDLFYFKPLEPQVLWLLIFSPSTPFTTSFLSSFSHSFSSLTTTQCPGPMASIQLPEVLLSVTQVPCSAMIGWNWGASAQPSISWVGSHVVIPVLLTRRLLDKASCPYVAHTHHNAEARKCAWPIWARRLLLRYCLLVVKNRYWLL